MKRTGITLIGMPGSGKSTIGKLLSKRLSFRFIDLDLFIKEKGGESHDTIANVQGESALLGLEEKYALALDLDRAVFSPGGSIIYSKKAMEKLRKETAVF
ncbi:MAG TPA: shikimate kinase, partial [Candidatus Paceibacterota bacterium]|nr:shikimate kinase [Candidatus Paceibacterota bacterium]